MKHKHYILLFLLLLALPLSIVAQDVIDVPMVPEKKTEQTCSTCGKFLSKCRFGGKHPKPTPKPIMFTANGVSFKMIRVEGLGSPFYIGETEVTQALWEAVMGNNPSKFKGSDRPVDSVFPDDCKEFIRKLNSLTGKTFRLPKEREWEYAAKGGNKSRGYKYSGSNTLDDVAWYWRNSGDTYLSGDYDWDKFDNNNCCTHPVARKKANELGLYDMSGNVIEWCDDLVVPLGGSWSHGHERCRVLCRDKFEHWGDKTVLGLRLAL